ncbi:MAG: hypothetical protein PHY92_03900 [Alphaproteobacteria bacterium]|nr:hypothetical protein [Alphaproteobacteria bacterium]
MRADNGSPMDTDVIQPLLRSRLTNWAGLEAKAKEIGEALSIEMHKALSAPHLQDTALEVVRDMRSGIVMSHAVLKSAANSIARGARYNAARKSKRKVTAPFAMNDIYRAYDIGSALGALNKCAVNLTVWAGDPEAEQTILKQITHVRLPRNINVEAAIKAAATLYNQPLGDSAREKLADLIRQKKSRPRTLQAC